MMIRKVFLLLKVRVSQACGWADKFQENIQQCVWQTHGSSQEQARRRSGILESIVKHSTIKSWIILIYTYMHWLKNKANKYLNHHFAAILLCFIITYTFHNEQ
jgi:hypothetical protein